MIQKLRQGLGRKDPLNNNVKRSNSFGHSTNILHYNIAWVKISRLQIKIKENKILSTVYCTNIY